MPGMIGGSAPTALSQYNPSQLTPQDRMMMFGAMLHDTGNSLRGSGDAESAMNLKMLLAQQQMARQGFGMIGSLYGGGAQPPSAPQVADPTASLPAPPPAIDDLQGNIRATLGKISPPSPAPAPPPTMLAPQALATGGGARPSLRDPKVQQMLAYMKFMGNPAADLIEKMLADGQPDVALGPDGRSYDKRSADSLQMHFRNPTNINNTVVDTNDPNNTNRVIPSAPVNGAQPVYNNRGEVTDWTLPKGVQSTIQLQQLPAMLRGQAAMLDAGVSAGKLTNDQIKNSYAPPPGFRVRVKGNR